MRRDRRVSAHQLPEVLDADGVGGRDHARRRAAVRPAQGTPMIVGMMDTSAAMLLAGARPGQLLNSSGSTDVLALCTDRPRPHERLLTRALGVGRLWLSVSTIAAAGSSLTWVQQQLFPDLSQARVHVRCVATRPTADAESSVTFEPYLAGDRMSIEQRRRRSPA